MRKNHRLFRFILPVFLVLLCSSAHAAEIETVPAGAVLPEFKIQGPAARADQEYLGLGSSDPFTLSQVSGKLVIMDFLSVL